MNSVLMSGMANADTYAAIGIAAMLSDRAQPIMARIAPIKFHTHFAGREIKLVMKDDDVR